jgi:hypothetical protein
MEHDGPRKLVPEGLSTGKFVGPAGKTLTELRHKAT